MLSGTSHVRYDHKSRPTLIEVSCPQCGTRCAVRKESEKDFGCISGDCSGTWHKNDWSYTCSKCIRKVENLSYEELPGLFYSNGDIWAWNREHLLAIESHIEEKLDPSNPYSWFMTYLHKDWLKNKSRTLKIIGEMKNL